MNAISVESTHGAVNLVETFERFLKEVAAGCVDNLAEFAVDDRFNVFSIKGTRWRPISTQVGQLANRFANRLRGSTARRLISVSEGYCPTRFKGAADYRSTFFRSNPRPTCVDSRR